MPLVHGLYHTLESKTPSKTTTMKAYPRKRRDIPSGRADFRFGANSNFSRRLGDHRKIHRRFDTKWIHPDVLWDESRLGTGDVQSVADLGNSFELVRKIKLTQSRKVISSPFPFRA